MCSWLPDFEQYRSWKTVGGKAGSRAPCLSRTFATDGVQAVWRHYELGTDTEGPAGLGHASGKRSVLGSFWVVGLCQAHPSSF